MFRKATLLATVFALAILAASPGQAASVSYYLDQSNALPDGVNYLQVTISDGLDGAVDFLVEVDTALDDIAGSNFGIQKFGFNVAEAYSVSATNISGLPSGWSLANGQGQLSGFGRYDVVLQGTGNGRQSPLAFSIVGIDGDTVHDYAQLAGLNDSQGPSLFAAHVAGFGYGDEVYVSSGFFGGIAPVPAPPAAWLLLTGLAGLLGRRLWVRR